MNQHFRQSRCAPRPGLKRPEQDRGPRRHPLYHRVLRRHGGVAAGLRWHSHHRGHRPEQTTWRGGATWLTVALLGFVVRSGHGNRDQPRRDFPARTQEIRSRSGLRETASPRGSRPRGNADS